MVSITMALSLWGDNAHKWTFVLFIGPSGGLILLWDSDRVIVGDILKGKLSVSVLCSLVGFNEEWACSTVYRPCAPSEKLAFLE